MEDEEQFNLISFMISDEFGVNVSYMNLNILMHKSSLMGKHNILLSNVEKINTSLLEGSSNSRFFYVCENLEFQV